MEHGDGVGAQGIVCAEPVDASKLPRMSSPEAASFFAAGSPGGAVVRVERAGPLMRVVLAGRWKVTEEKPDWTPAGAGEGVARVRVEMGGDLVDWDSSLLLFAHEVRTACEAAGLECELDGLPEGMRELLGRFTQACAAARPRDRSLNFAHGVGVAATDMWQKGREIAHFVGECALSASWLAKRPHKFRWRDFVEEMQSCGAMALPIVSLIGLLVGLILAYQAAVLMRQFGADIYVADAVGLAMVREMGAMMTAVILAGRTGAAFAAILGNMRANDEIDALTTLGIRPVDFLVMPRLAALALMTPLLTLYSMGMGVLGGMFVSLVVLDIPPAAYWVQTVSAIDLSDLASGLIKSGAFGLLVGLAGCHRGLLAERSAAGVGRAATSAVVMGLLLIIIADALFAVAFNVLGI